MFEGMERSGYGVGAGVVLSRDRWEPAATSGRREDGRARAKTGEAAGGRKQGLSRGRS